MLSQDCPCVLPSPAEVWASWFVNLEERERLRFSLVLDNRSLTLTPPNGEFSSLEFQFVFACAQRVRGPGQELKGRVSATERLASLCRQWQAEAEIQRALTDWSCMSQLICYDHLAFDQYQHKSGRFLPVLSCWWNNLVNWITLLLPPKHETPLTEKETMLLPLQYSHTNPPTPTSIPGLCLGKKRTKKRKEKAQSQNTTSPPPNPKHP